MATGPLTHKWILAVPLILITAGAVVFHKLARPADAAALKAGNSYDVWLAEAEASPTRPDGGQWDMDGSAPDLAGVLVWKGQRVLETVTSPDQLIARWDPVALNLYKVIANGEADTASVRRVGHIRMESDGVVEAGVFDSDLGNVEFVGGFRIPLRSLHLGINQLHGSGMLKSLSVVVEKPGGHQADPEAWRLDAGAEGVSEMTEPPDSMKGAASRFARDITTTAKDALKPLGKDLQEAEQQADDAARKAAGWIQKHIGE